MKFKWKFIDFAFTPEKEAELDLIEAKMMSQKSC